MSEIFNKLKDMIIEKEPEVTTNTETAESESTETVNASYEQPANKKVSNVNAKMVIKEPRSFEEAQEIAKNLLNKKACVVNIHRLQESSAIRLLDFLSGVTFAIEGDIQKIDDNVFLFSPKELPVAGNISNGD